MSKAKIINNKSQFVNKLGSVYLDINNIKIEDSDTMDTLFKKFYSVMDKWKICQGTWNGNGRTISNPEWNICWQAFQNKIMNHLMFMNILKNPPKNLLAYGKRVVSKKYK